MSVVLVGSALACSEPVAPPIDGLTSDADAVTTMVGSPSVEVRGELRGSATPTLLSAPQQLYRVDVTASGVLTGVGRVSAQWALPQVVLDLAAGQGVAQSTTWSGTITAANGDRITGQYTLRSAAVPVTVSGGFTVVADLTITGGTGRFASLSGSGTALVRGNVLSQVIGVSLDGALLRGR